MPATRAGRRRAPNLLVALAALAAFATPARAGGTAENLLILIDPTSDDSLYLGNYYRHARAVPDCNVLYMAPGASDYAAFVSYNLPALFGFLADAGTEDHIDYILVMPGAPFYVRATNLVSDGCYPVGRFSISSAYTMAFIADHVLAGGLPSTTRNEYYSTATARAFDSQTAWYLGAPSGLSFARRYFIGAMLGFTGSYGNTPAQLTALIDRSVAADGTRPAGTFYFMNNAADPDRNVRVGQFSGAVAAIQALGGAAEVLDGVLPADRHDCLGILTGAASLPLASTPLTILAGAFCDHLTSYAARFDTSSQTKVSAWIARGASGSWGTVEEPCNYPGKFPHAMLHSHYLEGLSLGEAALRSVNYVPFQGLLYGDPLARPFAHLPAVTVPDAPAGPVSGTIVLTPHATTTHPTAAIAAFDLLIDGVRHAWVAPGAAFTLDTTQLADGWHDLRVLATDDTLVASTGRWLGQLTVSNLGRAAALAVTPTAGNRTTAFVFDVAASGAHVREVRVVQNGRIVAAAAGSAASLTVYGLTLGAGPVEVQGEALYADGTRVRSAPTLLDVAPAAGTPAGQPPIAFGYTRLLRRDGPTLVELPATCDDGSTPLTFEILGPPAQTEVVAGPAGPYRLLRPLPGAAGVDRLTFRAVGAAGPSEPATIKLVYDIYPLGDLNCSGRAGFDDIDPLVIALTGQAAYETLYPGCEWLNGDIDGDGTVGFEDIDPFVILLAGQG